MFFPMAFSLRLVSGFVVLTLTRVNIHMYKYFIVIVPALPF
jgi:hypothetical protein